MPVEPYRDIAPAVAAGVFLHASAQIIGDVRAGDPPTVTLVTLSGATRRVDPLQGEGLPRIC